MPSKIVRQAAEAHFRKLGDKVKLKSESNPHAAYDVVRGQISRYAYPRVGYNWMDAEDAVQDAYVKVLETAKANEFFNFGGLYKIWLDRAISKVLADQRQKGLVITEDAVVDHEHGLTLIDTAESSDPEAELLMEMQERVDHIMEVSNRLPPKAKAIVRLFLIFGYTYKEISSMLNISKKRVDNTLTYFKGKLNE